MKFLTAIPVYNEERHLEKVLRQVRRYAPEILVVPGTRAALDTRTAAGTANRVNKVVAVDTGCTENRDTVPAAAMAAG